MISILKLCLCSGEILHRDESIFRHDYSGGRGRGVRALQPSPLSLTLYPSPSTPGQVIARCFDRECKRRLLVRGTGRRFAVSRLPHIMRHELQK